MSPKCLLRSFGLRRSTETLRRCAQAFLRQGKPWDQHKASRGKCRAGGRKEGM
uniref:Uncharacterized protein n=1 Tax=Anguilla anguilla TaxID=7936 RepID=A0A0E9T7H1_ANGAN